VWPCASPNHTPVFSRTPKPIDGAANGIVRSESLQGAVNTLCYAKGQSAETGRAQWAQGRTASSSCACRCCLRK
jgi:hypothetical protein